MTTLTTNTPLSQLTDADYQAWGSEMNASLTTIGLTQTADTGQVDWTTTTRPTANVATDYEIWRFNDTLQSTKPIFIKFNYGANRNNVARMDVTVGTASDGAGNLTGVTTNRSTIGNGGGIPLPTMSCISRYCYNAAAGFLGVVWKLGCPSGGTQQNIPWGGFTIQRSNDTTGAPTGRSVTVRTGGNAPTTYNSTFPWQQALNFTSGDLYPDFGDFVTYGGYGWANTPVSAQTSAEGGDVSCVACLQSDPVFSIDANLALGILGEIAVGSTVSVALVGSTPVTLLSVGTLYGATQCNPQQMQVQNTFLMLWQ